MRKSDSSHNWEDFYRKLMVSSFYVKIISPDKKSNVEVVLFLRCLIVVFSVLLFV